MGNFIKCLLPSFERSVPTELDQVYVVRSAALLKAKSGSTKYLFFKCIIIKTFNDIILVIYFNFLYAFLSNNTIYSLSYRYSVSPFVKY